MFSHAHWECALFVGMSFALQASLRKRGIPVVALMLQVRSAARKFLQKHWQRSSAMLRRKHLSTGALQAPRVGAIGVSFGNRFRAPFATCNRRVASALFRERPLPVPRSEFE